ncbi:hypothetical protein CR513_32691, partial [Mucuna pruriens]
MGSQFLCPSIDNGALWQGRASVLRRQGEEPFVYMYETVLADLGVVLPFEFFEADVLRMLGIAPSQLHPNGWAAIQAFKVVCLTLGVLPTTSIFLSHYTTRVGQSVGWVSLTPLPNTGLFTSYTASYKGFKSRFIKIKAAEVGHFCVDPRPLPLYWREPSKYKGLVRSQLPLEARVNLQILDSLPRGINYKDIVSWISSNNATLRLKSMLKKQGIDMADLIKKARLINDARSTGRKAPSAETAITTAEKKWAASLAEKDSTLVVEKLTAPAVSDKEAAKRKADSVSAEEAAAKKGKAAAAPSSPPVPIEPSPSSQEASLSVDQVLTFFTKDFNPFVFNQLKGAFLCIFHVEAFVAPLARPSENRPNGRFVYRPAMTIGKALEWTVDCDKKEYLGSQADGMCPLSQESQSRAGASLTN